MAERILDAGFPMTIWARRPEALEQWKARGARLAPNPRELARRSDIVGICVGGDADVAQVIEGPDGILSGAQPGTVVMIHSTVDPLTCDRIAASAADRNVAVADVPVSGSGEAAQAGKLVVLFGGEESSFEACRPVMETFGDPILYVGPLGTAQLAKLLNNGLVIGNQSLARDALELGQAFGLDRERLIEVFRHASGRSYALEVLTSAHVTGARRETTAHIMKKDLDTLRSVSERTDAAELGRRIAAVGDRMRMYLETDV